MISNYFKTAWRHLVKDRMHSFINIVSLALGMSVAILIALWMYDELSFNKNFTNHTRIGQVIQNVSNNGGIQTWWSVPYPLSAELRQNYGSDFRRIVMAGNWTDHLITIGDKKIKSNGGFFEKDMPDMFTLDMVQGSRDALKDPSTVIISASAARAWFGTDAVMGRQLIVGRYPPLKVGGVFKDLPMNSTLAKLSFVGSWDFYAHCNDGFKDMEDPWRANFTTLFAEISENTDFATVSLKIKDAKLKKVNEQLQKKRPALFLQPMDRWHLYSDFKEGVEIGGAITYVRMFGAIGLFVLLLACINFMNLTTARSQRRAREVGVRKTMGSLRSQLISQFFSESLLTVTFACIISILVAWACLPLFNAISEKQMNIPWTDARCWTILVAFTVITAVVAGSYPALYLSSFNPVKVLKGTFKSGPSAALPRKILVALQFSVSVCLIICTITVYRQLQYARSRPVGYSRANLITVPETNPDIHSHFKAVRDELINTGVVASVAESESPTTGVWNTTSGFSWPGKDPNLSTDFGVMNISEDYGSTIQWEMIQGRSFSKDFPTDSAAVILNEAAMKFMHLDKPLGQIMTWWGRPLKVIGIIRDMVIESPYKEARPLIYTLLSYPGNVAILRLTAGTSTTVAIEKIAPVFRKYSPDEVFEYKFVDDEYGKKFGNEERVGKLAGIFTTLAVIISCLGVFGLTSFVAEQRKKEIGVRKVLGASVVNIWHLLSREFIVLVVTSFVVAMPLAVYLMNDWLRQYTYRTNLSWWIFIAAAIGALAITMLTVSFQAIRAAIANPVKSLRTE